MEGLAEGERDGDRVGAVVGLLDGKGVGAADAVGALVVMNVSTALLPDLPSGHTSSILHVSLTTCSVSKWP